MEAAESSGPRSTHSKSASGATEAADGSATPPKHEPEAASEGPAAEAVAPAVVTALPPPPLLLPLLRLGFEGDVFAGARAGVGPGAVAGVAAKRRNRVAYCAPTPNGCGVPVLVRASAVSEGEDEEDEEDENDGQRPKSVDTPAGFIAATPWSPTPGIAPTAAATSARSPPLQPLAPLLLPLLVLLLAPPPPPPPPFPSARCCAFKA